MDKSVEVFDNLGSTVVEDMEPGDPAMEVVQDEASFFVEKARASTKKPANFKSLQGDITIPALSREVAPAESSIEYQVGI